MSTRLQNYTIGKATLSDQIFLGKLDKKGRTWLDKKDITSLFIEVMLSYVGVDQTLTVNGSEGSVYEITVEKIKDKND